MTARDIILAGSATTGPIRIHSVTEAAGLLGCTESWLKEKARLREIPHTIIGGRYGFTAQHITEIVTIYERRPEDTPAVTPAPRRSSKAPKVADSTVTPLRSRPPKRRRSA